MMEAANTSETSVNFYQTTRCNIPADSHLQEMMHSGLMDLVGRDNFEDMVIDGCIVLKLVLEK
jgi:hypothetical protein